MQILLFFLFARPIGAARLPKFAHRRIVRISADRVESKPEEPARTVAILRSVLEIGISVNRNRN